MSQRQSGSSEENCADLRQVEVRRRVVHWALGSVGNCAQKPPSTKFSSFSWLELNFMTWPLLPKLRGPYVPPDKVELHWHSVSDDQ